MSVDRDDFAAFVMSSSGTLFRGAVLLTGNEDLAKDLVQATLMKVWVRWKRIRRSGAEVAYTRKVMFSLFLSWKRRKWESEVPTAEFASQTLSRDAHAAAETRQVVLAALSSLPSRQRAVVVLRFFEDLSEAQIAETLSCSRGTVKSQTSKALARLREYPGLQELNRVPK